LPACRSCFGELAVDADLKMAYLYCQRLARAEAGNFYWAFRFLPKMKRWALSAVYAFCRMADDFVDHASDPQAARHSLRKMLNDLNVALNGTTNVSQDSGSISHGNHLKI
jgi:phytoene/squalene synthetase